MIGREIDEETSLLEHVKDLLFFLCMVLGQKNCWNATVIGNLSVICYTTMPTKSQDWHMMGFLCCLLHVLCWPYHGRFDWLFEMMDLWNQVLNLHLVTIERLDKSCRSVGTLRLSKLFLMGDQKKFFGFFFGLENQVFGKKNSFRLAWTKQFLDKSLFWLS